MGKAKTIVSGVVWTIMNNVVSIVYGIISVPFLINYFGKEEYGLIGIAISVNVYIHLLDMGMTNSNVRFFSEYIAKKDDNNLQKLFNLTHLLYLCLGVLNTLILFGLSFFTDDFFKVSSDQAVTLRNLLWVLALNATFSWVSACFDQLLTANDLLSWIKRRSTLLKLMQFGVLLATIVFELSIEVYFLGYVFIVTVILPLTIVKAKKELPNIKHTIGFDRAIFNTIVPYALSIFSFSIFQFCAFNFRPLFLGSLSGPASVAEFSIMNTIASVVTILSGSFMQVLLPIITKMKVQYENQGILDIMTNGTKYVVILVSAVIFMLILSMKELLCLYVGDDYITLSPWICSWLLTLLLSHRNVMTSLVFTERKIVSVAVMGAFAMFVAIALYILLIPEYGVGGVVIGFMVHELIHTLFYYINFIPKKFGINTFLIFYKSVLPTWLTGTVLVALVYSFSAQFCFQPLMATIIKSVVFATLYGFVIYVFVLNRVDKKVIKSFLHIQV